MENIKDLIIDWFDKHEAIFVILILALFWIRVFINSYLLNDRDKTNRFILFLNPFLSSSWRHWIESMFKFYWPLRDNKMAAKKLVNFLSIAFLVLVIVSILFSQLFIQNTEKSGYDGKIKSVKTWEYEKYIFAHNTNREYITSMIKEYGTLTGDSTRFDWRDFGFARYDNWTIVKLPEKLQFYYFHNLANWFYGYEKKSQLPDFTLGIAIHKTIVSETYYFYQDPNNLERDTQIGVMNNGKSFFVYLPESYYAFGNLKISPDVNLSKTDLLNFMRENDINIDTLKYIDYELDSVKINKINGH